MKHIKTNSGTYPNSKRRIRGPCPYCSCTMIQDHPQRMPTRDHIRPRSRFPEDRRTIIVCSECNLMKRDLTLNEFVTVLRTQNMQLRLAMQVNEDRIQNISYLLNLGLDLEE